MNKLLALTLLGFVLIALTGAEEAKETVEVEAVEAREARAVAEKKKGEKGAKPAGKKEKKGAKKNAAGKQKGGKKKSAGKKKGKKSAGGKKQKKAGKGKKSGKKAGKKSGKKAGKKAGKKSAKKAGKKAGKKSQGRQSTGCLAATCLDTAVVYLSLVRSKAATLKGQANRITKLNTTAGKRGGKKDSFNQALGLLVDAGGGNSSALACGGKTTGTGATQLANLSSALTDCPSTIAAACTLPALPATFSTCSATVARFSGNVETCLNLTVTPSADPAATCTCWADSKLSADVAAVKACNLADAVSSMSNVSSACTAAVLKCNQLQKTVPSTMHSCNQNPSALLSKLKTLDTNKADAQKVQKKISDLTGKSSSSGLKAKRAPATTCTGVANDVNNYLTTLNANPAATTLAGLAADIYNAGSVTCSASDLATLNTAAAAISSAITAIEQQITAVQASIQVLTGSTASPSAIASAPACSNPNCNPSADLATTTASMATKAAGHRRRRVVEEILREKLM